MFLSSLFKIFVVPSIFFRHVVADSNHHRGRQNGGDVPSSLDFHPDLATRNSFTEASPLLPTNGDDALLSEQFVSSPSLDNGGNVGPIIGAESDGCPSTPTQLSNKMRRVKRGEGICNAIQGTKKSDSITRPGQQQHGEQENTGRTTPSSKKPPSPPLPLPLKSGDADELCLSFGSYYRVCAPAYIESRILSITFNLDQCRPCMSIPAVYSPYSPQTHAKVPRTWILTDKKSKAGLFVIANLFLCDCAVIGLDCNPDETSFCCADIKWVSPIHNHHPKNKMRLDIKTYIYPKSRTNLRYPRSLSRSLLPHFIRTRDINVHRPDLLDQGVLANRRGIGPFKNNFMLNYSKAHSSPYLHMYLQKNFARIAVTLSTACPSLLAFFRTYIKWFCRILQTM